MRKPAFCICENNDADQLRGVTAKLISVFVFATRIVQSLYFLNPKFQASCHLLRLYSLDCVGPGRKPRGLVFSERGSFAVVLHLNCCLTVIIGLFPSVIHQKKLHLKHCDEHDEWQVLSHAKS